MNVRFNDPASAARSPRHSTRPVWGICRLIGWLLVFIAFWSAPAFPQAAKTSASPCTVGVRAAAFGFWTWALKTRVKVYILQLDFKSEEIPYLLAPLRTWDAVWESTGSGVRLDYEGTTLAPALCQNCLTIMRAPIFNRSLLLS